MHQISTEQLLRMREKQDDLPLINVLTEDEFRQQQIPGSENIPINDKNFLQRVEETAGGRDRPVVVYCADEECKASTNAARQLEKAGFKDVNDYAGGMKAWEEAGQPVQAGVA